VETVVETVTVGIYYHTVRNPRNIRHDCCDSVECKCLLGWLNSLLRILTTKKRRIMSIIFLYKTDNLRMTKHRGALVQPLLQWQHNSAFC